MSVQVKHDTFTDSLIMSNDASSSSRITIPCWAMDLITKDYKHEIDRLKVENEKLRKMAEKYVRQAYALACEKGNPITRDIIVENAREFGIEVD